MLCVIRRKLHLLCRVRRQDIRIASVEDGKSGAPEKLATSSAQLDVVAGEVVNVRLRKHGVVLQFGLSQWGSVASNDDKLGLAASQALERRFVAESDFAGFHHKRESRTNSLVSFSVVFTCKGLSCVLDGVLGLLRLLGSHRCAFNL